MKFTNRNEAGKLLAEKLSAYSRDPAVMVLGLPRGGVPVAYEVAVALDAPLDVFVVRKLGVPYQPELAMGAIASGGTRIINQSVVDLLNISAETIETVAAEEQRELERREQVYRGQRPPLKLEGKIAIVVDDGLATGATMRAAVQAMRTKNPHLIVVAVPVSSLEASSELRAVVDDMVCLFEPEEFFAVGLWYADFTPTDDDEVRALLERRTAQEV